MSLKLFCLPVAKERVKSWKTYKDILGSKLSWFVKVQCLNYWKDYIFANIGRVALLFEQT